MVRGRLAADEQPFRYLGVGQSQPDQGEYLLLPAGQHPGTRVPLNLAAVALAAGTSFAASSASTSSASTGAPQGRCPALRPFSQPGGYVGFDMDEDQERVRTNYRQHHARLVSVKQRYDPHNLFRRNQNIIP